MPVERPSFRQTGASVALDAMRGAAALLVLFDHCKNLFFVDRNAAMQASAYPHLVSFFYVFASAGPQAVVIFLVLSGYLIGGSILRMVRVDRWSWKSYLTHRFVRLWLVLLPALALCACWDAARVAMASSALHGPSGSYFAELAGAGVTWTNLLGNVFFLQTLRTPTFGSDRVLWSLAAEFWYYLLFPLVFFCDSAGSAGLDALPVWSGVSPRGHLCRKRIAGTLSCLVMRRSAGRRQASKAEPAGTCGCPCALRPFGLPLHRLSLAVAPLQNGPYVRHGDGRLSWIILSAQGPVRESAAVVRACRSLAGMSYSLYLAHYPMLKFFAQWLAPTTHWRIGASTLAAGATFGALAVLYGYGLAACTEWHNDRVRPWIEARLRSRNAGITSEGFRAPARIVAG